MYTSIQFLYKNDVLFVFTSSCLQEGSCLIYAICVCLYLQLFVGGIMSYLCYLCLSLPPVVCRRDHVLFMLFVLVFTSRCLQEGSCLIYVICVCLYLQLFVGGLMSYLRYLCSSLPPVVCRRAHVLFMLFLFVCLQQCPTHIELCFFSLLYTICFQFLWLVNFRQSLRYSLTFIQHINQNTNIPYVGYDGLLLLSALKIILLGNLNYYVFHKSQKEVVTIISHKYIRGDWAYKFVL